jgi:hypothetical protein
MHIIASILLILGAVAILAAGLISVMKDLLERGPHDVPWLTQQESASARRFEPIPASAAEDVRGGRRYATSSAWSADQAPTKS